MIIKRLQINGYRAFETLDVRFEDNVTVLTGENDTGKSTILDCLDACLSRRPMHIEEVYRPHISGSDVGNPSVEGGLHVLLQQSDIDNKRITKGISIEFQAGDVLVISVRLTRQKSTAKLIKHVRGGQSSNINPIEFSGIGWFRVIWIRNHTDPANTIRPKIPLKSPNKAEQAFLKAAFGGAKNWQQLPKLNAHMRSSRVRGANERLQSALKEWSPTNLDLNLQIACEGSEEIIVNVMDSHGVSVQPLRRGSGVRKSIDIMAKVLSELRDGPSHVVLLDEPENSLHPSAQKSLRHFLERLAQRSSLQVVYATHSPMMLNTLKPKSIRLVKRESVAIEEPLLESGAARSYVVNNVVHNNLTEVTRALGVELVDSLVFADIIVLVEGKTEVVGIPRILEKMHASDDSNFARALNLLGHVRLLSTSEIGFTKLLRVVRCFQLKTIVFLDGDDEGKKNHATLLAEHPKSEVKYVVISDDREIEQTVSTDAYISALKEVLSLDERFTAEMFTEWDQSNERGKAYYKDSFTRRVRSWVATCLGKNRRDVRFPKEEIFLKAVNEGPTDAIDTAPYLGLLKSIESLLGE